MLRQIVKRSQHRHHDPRGDRNIVHAGRVAQRHARRNVVEQPVHARRHGLYHLKILETSNGSEHARAVIVGDQKLTPTEPFRKGGTGGQVVDDHALRQQRPVLGGRLRRDPDVDRHPPTLHRHNQRCGLEPQHPLPRRPAP